MFDNLIKEIDDEGIDVSQIHKLITSPNTDVLTISNALQAVVFVTTVLTVIKNEWIVPDILILAHTLDGLSEVEEFLFHSLAKVTPTTLIMGEREGTSVLDFYRKDNGKSLKEAFDDATDQPPENI